MKHDWWLILFLIGFVFILGGAVHFGHAQATEVRRVFDPEFQGVSYSFYSWGFIFLAVGSMIIFGAGIVSGKEVKQ